MDEETKSGVREKSTVEAASAKEVGRSGFQPSPTVQLLEESLDIAKRETVRGTVRVQVRTEAANEIASVALDHTSVDVRRVPMERKVDAPPAIRTEGDTTIVPVIEERVVMVKHLYVVEEIHIRRRVEQELSSTPVQLRRQVASVEYVEPEEHLPAAPHEFRVHRPTQRRTP